MDKELLLILFNKDRLHSKAYKISPFNRSTVEWEQFRSARNTFKSLMRKKMINYFLNKDNSFFKSSKNYWRFYKTIIKNHERNTIYFF